MEWKFNREGVEESVSLERWVWGVVYTDGSELHQFGEDGVFHQFREIDQSRVQMFVMYSPADGRRYDLVVSPEMKLIHFYRNIRTPDTGGKFVKVYVFGYEKNIDGRNQQVLNFIMPDDRIVMADTDKISLLDYNLLKGTENV